MGTCRTGYLSRRSPATVWRKIESTSRGVLAYTQDTRSSRLLGYTHTTVTGRTAIQPSFVFYCGTIITYIMDPVLFQDGRRQRKRKLTILYK